MPLGTMTRPGFAAQQRSTDTTSAAGITITASGTAHTKGSVTELIASTSYDSYGIFVLLDNTYTAGANTSMLLDVMTGGAGSEVVLIPDLACGYALNENLNNAPIIYFFPIFIPASTRLSARCQAAVVSDTVNCRVVLLQRPTVRGWVGSRVTAYGVTAASSTGISITCGNSAYGTAAQLSSSTTNPIRYLQLGLQGGADTSLSDYRAMFEVRHGASTAMPGLSGLIGAIDAQESVGFAVADSQLAFQALDWPAGVDLRVSGMVNGTTNNVYDVILYGVD